MDPSDIRWSGVDYHFHDECRSGSKVFYSGLGDASNSMTVYTGYSLAGPPKLKNKSLFALLPKDHRVLSSENVYLAEEVDGVKFRGVESTSGCTSPLETVGLVKESFQSEPELPFERVAGEANGFLYSTISTSGVFRLLEILPGPGAQLECRLHVCQLGNSLGIYEALSYTWDSYVRKGVRDERRPTLQCEISCNGHKTSIQKNLYDALQTLRRTDESRILWVDAICIDQNNTAEKSCQVGMMGRIFSGAKRVLVWVGQCEDRCWCGDTELESSRETIARVFSGICLIVNKWLAHNGRDYLKATFSAKGDDGCLALNEHQLRDNGNILGVNMATLKDILRFFGRRWFTRIWVVQEVVLASSAQVFAGDYEIAWDWIGLTAAVIRANFSDLSLPEFCPVPNGLMNAYLMYRLSTSQTCLAPLKFSFLQLLQLTRQFVSTEVHDKVYGLLGLETTDAVAANIVSNYEVGIAELYEIIARLVLKSDDSLSLLSSARLTSLTTSSWVPEWGEPAFSNVRPTHAHKEFNCASKGTRQLRYPNEKPELEVRGIIIEKVKNISSKSLHSVTRGYRSGRLGDMQKNGTTLQSILDKMGCSNEAIKSFAMTLTAGTDGHGYAIDSPTSHVANCISLLLAEDSDLADLLAFLLDQKISSKKTGESLLRLEDFEKIGQDGNSAHYKAAMRNAFSGRALFITSSGKLGIGPKEGTEGDLVCVFLGADVPFVVRSKGNGYILVGECYIYDFMHGEILDRMSDPELKGELREEWIKLV